MPNRCAAGCGGRVAFKWVKCAKCAKANGGVRDPSGKCKRLNDLHNPIYKASGKAAEYTAKYRASGHAAEYRAKPSTKIKTAEYHAKYNASDKGKRKAAKYSASNKGKRKAAEYGAKYRAKLAEQTRRAAEAWITLWGIGDIQTESARVGIVDSIMSKPLPQLRDVSLLELVCCRLKRRSPLAHTPTRTHSLAGGAPLCLLRRLHAALPEAGGPALAHRAWCGRVR